MGRVCGTRRNSYWIYVGKPDEKRRLGKWEVNIYIKIILKRF
jgi:hypothetical protein